MIAALALLIVAVGLGLVWRSRQATDVAKSTASGTSTVPVAPASAMLDLLTRVPASYDVVDAPATLVDVRAARAAWTIDPPKDGDPAPAASDDLTKLVEQPAGLDLAFSSLCKDCRSGTVADARAGDLNANGFSLADLDATVQTDRSFMVFGRFDPAVAERALTPANHEVTRTTYRDSIVLTVTCKATTPGPVPDPLGVACITFGGAQIVQVVNAGLIGEAASLEAAHAMVDRQAGEGPSAADDPEARAMAVGADTVHAYTLRFLPPATVRCGEAGPCAFDPYYVAGTHGALGLTHEAGHAAASVVYVLSNAAASAASQNAAVVSKWYTQGSAIGTVPLSTKYDPPTTTVDGGVTVVVVPMKPGVPTRDLWESFASRNYPAW